MSESVRDLDRGGRAVRSTSGERGSPNGDSGTPAWLREVADREPGNGDADSPLAAVRPVMQGFHRWNVKKTYLELKAQ